MNKFTPITNDFSEIVKGRRSIRQYDPAVKISKAEMTQILEDAVRAPSSINMQPWRFVVVESDEAKATLKPLIRFNVNQNETSAAMILVFGDLDHFDNAEKILNQAVDAGLMPVEVKETQLATFTPAYENISDQKLRDTVLIDGALVSMQLMLTARAYGYDTNPIGGFEEDQLAAAFDLDPARYVPVMILSIGKATDVGYESVRLPIDEITTWK